MTHVKICGICQIEHALAAADAGADFIGLVFAPSKRQVDAKRARKIVAEVKKHQSPPQTVGVFVNTPAIEVNRIVEYCGLDRVQLSGDEPWSYIGDIAVPVIKAIRVHRYLDNDSLLADLEKAWRFTDDDFLFLLDRAVPGSYGGTGQAFDWKLARGVTERLPVIIAGGLSPENVAKAIRIARPWGVDVSSGVESDGVKDTARIKAFISAVRKCDGG
jgi:phosphoribosylanthranilate isomerase